MRLHGAQGAQNGFKMASNGLKGLEIGLKSLQKWVKTGIYFQQSAFADQRLRKRGLFRPSLNKFKNDLEQAQKAMSNIDGELGSVSYDPHNPESIDAAVQQVEKMIDDRIGSYANNIFIKPMIKQLKEHYRIGIIDKAASVRMMEGLDNDQQ